MDELKREEEHRRPEDTRAREQADECETVEDPVRKGLCKICQKPVLGELPFCQDHAPEVP